MGSERMLFPLAAAGEVRVELEVVLEGRDFTLVHVFREPTVEDRKAFWGFLGHSEMLSRGGGERADYLGASELLYDRCILRTEGYDFPEGSVAGWETLVPLEHKAWGVTRLLSRAGSLSGAEIKN